jgi:plasmid stabilization system protein ParE
LGRDTRLDAQLGYAWRVAAPETSKTVKVVVAAEAVADFARLRSFLEEENPAAAERAIFTIENAIRLLEILPNRGRPAGIPRVRELIVPFGHSAYVIRYGRLARADTLIILRIWHGRERR